MKLLFLNITEDEDLWLLCLGLQVLWLLHKLFSSASSLQHLQLSVNVTIWIAFKCQSSCFLKCLLNRTIPPWILLQQELLGAVKLCLRPFATFKNKQKPPKTSMWLAKKIHVLCENMLKLDCTWSLFFEIIFLHAFLKRTGQLMNAMFFLSTQK